jgi:hypothetical protein
MTDNLTTGPIGSNQPAPPADWKGVGDSGGQSFGSIRIPEPIGSNQMAGAAAKYDAQTIGWNSAQSIDWRSVALTVISPAIEPAGSNQVDFSKPQLALHSNRIVISCGQVSRDGRTYALGEFHQKFRRAPTEQEMVKPDYSGMGPGIIVARGVMNKNIPMEQPASPVPDLQRRVSAVELKLSRLLTAIPLIMIVVMGLAALVAKFVK